MEKILAKIACPELDTELMKNPPNVWDWYFALTEDWRVRFAKLLETFSENSPSSVVIACPSFGLLIETIVTRVGIPQEFIPHRSHCHNYAYLIKEGIFDELRLASIIGTTPERAAQLNGAATQEEIEYYKAMKTDMPSNSNESFNTVAGKLAPEPALQGTYIQTLVGERLVKRAEADRELLDSCYGPGSPGHGLPPGVVVRRGAPDPMVHHPKHYTKGDIECIDAMASVVTGLEGMEAVHTANVIKYMWRWKDKNGLQDLEKAKWYLDKLIEKVKKEK